MGVEDRIADVERRLEESLKENAALREENAALREENAALREENAKLRREIEAWKRGFRERGKRRTSAAEGTRRGSGKRPGRRAGHAPATRPVPERIDETIEHAVPERCACGGAVDPIDESDSTVVQDIPPVRVRNVRHVAHVGRCRRCHKRVVAPLPGAVANGHSVAAVQVGPQASAMAHGLRFEQHVPLAGIATFFDTWFGLHVTPGGISQMFDRTRRWSRPNLDAIALHVRTAAVVGMDETGWRQDGVRGYAWLARTEQASLYRVELSRGDWVAMRMLGEAFAGTLCTDFYSVYTSHHEWRHAYCGAHLVREAKKIAELDPGPLTEQMRDALQIWYHDADRIRWYVPQEPARNLRRRLRALATNPRLALHPELARLQKRIRTHFDGLVSFVRDIEVPATNNATERDLRSLAVHRRVTGGTRSPNGSATLGHWMSLTQTLRKNTRSLRDFVIGLHDTHRLSRPPPAILPS